MQNNYQKISIKLVLFIIVFFNLISCCFADNKTTDDISLQNIYILAREHHLASSSFEERVLFYADLLQNIPYGSGGNKDDFKPSYTPPEFLSILLNKNEFGYSFDQLDCVTYIETVLALSYIHNNSYTSLELFQFDFEKHLKAIRYRNGIDTFWNRNHFTATEWFPNNSLLFSPITTKLSFDTLTSTININRLGWLYKTQFEQKYKQNFSEQDLKNLFTLEQHSIETYTVSSIPYISISHDNINKLSLESVIAGWPKISILNIVKLDWDLTSTIGTQLDISHQGFVVKLKDGSGNDKLYFMHATTSEPKKTVKEPLTDYLNKFTNHKNIKGINVYSVENNMQQHLQHQSLY